MKSIREMLVAKGHAVTSRWLEEGFPDTGVGRAVATEKHRQKWAGYDFNDVQTADTIISFTEKPPTGPGRGGRHVEFGLAAAWGKRLIVVGYRENVFHYLPQVEFFETFEQLLEVL
jgi:hypothetical protein